jgi:hypothetical protein
MNGVAVSLYGSADPYCSELAYASAEAALAGTSDVWRGERGGHIQQLRCFFFH